MVIATNQNGELNDIDNCYIDILGKQIVLNILPDITDQKGANYVGEPVIGRSSPMKSYSHSEERTVSMTLHFAITKPGDARKILDHIRQIQSAVYPREGNADVPFIPPPVCSINCGKLLGDKPLCVVLKSYNIRYPTDVAWDQSEKIYLPVKVDMETSWDVVYQSSKLPGMESIMGSGTND